ncbi:hypothetical protein DICPUDRAFT_92071 [Dictyostelium purpureum]|uniref:Uncharacterized protein n=1 Tax=Dictyostelium purpureum TaxID=5786 RepID=F0ZLJ8_DICPU|nr:uncharacterized protein DICPUDRAFT_92071 [Dictyostelium purpureum]EGC35204.1 hypothetical protein DICPUDRAFT_92071 [Dictyostelium purpureum]|eukprot:XP_003288292.1 hypothetical protein DICPUDRAFT_92071 [Dictyostelium purpureum]
MKDQMIIANYYKRTRNLLIFSAIASTVTFAFWVSFSRVPELGLMFNTFNIDLIWKVLFFVNLLAISGIWIPSNEKEQAINQIEDEQILLVNEEY